MKREVKGNFNMADNLRKILFFLIRKVFIVWIINVEISGTLVSKMRISVICYLILQWLQGLSFDLALITWEINWFVIDQRKVENWCEY